MTTERTDVGPGAGGVAGMVVGFVGLGNMGIPMTRRLVAAGYHVRGFDTSAQARGNFAAVGSAGAPGTGGTGTGGVTVADTLASVGDGASGVRRAGPERGIRSTACSRRPGSR